MKIKRMMIIGAFGAVAFSSWASPVYGRFDWSWTSAVPAMLDLGVVTVQQGLQAFLGSINDFYSSSSDIETWEDYCPSNSGDGIFANPSLVTRVQIGELIDRRRNGLRVAEVKKIVGEPLCFIEDFKLRWVGEGEILLDVSFTKNWMMKEGEIIDAK